MAKKNIRVPDDVTLSCSWLEIEIDHSLNACAILAYYHVGGVW